MTFRKLNSIELMRLKGVNEEESIPHTARTESEVRRRTWEGGRKANLPWMVRTMFVRHFIHIFSNDIMSFPNFQNQDQHPFCPKKTTHTNAPIIGIRIRRPMPQPKQHVLSVSFPKLSHKRKGKHKPPNAHNEQLHTPTPNNSSDSSRFTQNQ